MDNIEMAEANSTQQQNVAQAFDRLMTAIDESNGTDDEKLAAKSKVAACLHGAISAVADGGPRALIEHFKS